MTTRRKLPYDVEVQLKASEIQIGAVEIKDSETDNRLTVTSNGRALTSTIIENLPTEYPLPSSQVSELQNIRALNYTTDTVTVYQGDSWGVSVLNFPTDYPDSTAHIKLDTIISTLQQELTRIAKIQYFNGTSWVNWDKSVTVDNFPTDYPDSTTHTKLDVINTTLQTLATESTLSVINSKIVICDTGNISGTVNVSNFPSEYPLPSSQQTLLKNKLRIMAWNGSNYELIEGYEGSKSLTYDSNGNLTQIDLTIVLDDGTEKTVRRTFTYDVVTGDLTNISRWEVVS